MSYQGWTNYETYAINERFGEVFAHMGDYVEVTAAELRDTVRETFIVSKMTPIERDFVIASMNRVDWDELAEMYATEAFLVDEF
jgi:hypothetical protein